MAGKDKKEPARVDTGALGTLQAQLDAAATHDQWVREFNRAEKCAAAIRSDHDLAEKLEMHGKPHHAEALRKQKPAECMKPK